MNEQSIEQTNGMQTEINNTICLTTNIGICAMGLMADLPKLSKDSLHFSQLFGKIIGNTEISRRKFTAILRHVSTANE